MATPGVLLWFAAQLVAFEMAKAGDGWIGPTIFSATLLILYPVTCIRMVTSLFGSTATDVGVLLIAVTLDGLLVYNVKTQEAGYFLVAWDAASGLVTSWLGLWAGWQVLALVALVKKAG